MCDAFYLMEVLTKINWTVSFLKKKERKVENVFLEAFKHCHGGGKHDDAEAQLLAARHTFQQSYTKQNHSELQNSHNWSYTVN